MKYRFAAVLASVLLTACVTGPTYLGRAVTETPFKFDGGKTINLPATNAGALPAENDDYKIEGAGFNAALAKGDSKESQLTWTFSFVLKRSKELESVVVEQVTASGGLELIAKDDSPVLRNKNWVGRSVSRSMTKDLMPWLYFGSDSTFVFKFTMKAKDGSSIVMYQPSIISSGSKAIYLRVMGG